MEFAMVYERFDVEGEPATVGSRWKFWLKGFDLYADAKGLIVTEGATTNKQQRRALLLHSAGPQVQKIFNTFADTVTNDAVNYSGAVKALNDNFIPQVNSTFQRNVFREMVQSSSETVRQFATRLRQAGEHCKYTDLDEQIRDQIVQK